MTGYVDHALSGLATADVFVAEPERRAASLQEALVYATLALAEQQRVANIVALASLRVGPNEAPALRHLALQPKDEWSVEPTDEIKEALGL